MKHKITFIILLLTMHLSAQNPTYNVVVPLSENEIVYYNNEYFVIHTGEQWLIKDFENRTKYTFDELDISSIDGFQNEDARLHHFLKVNYSNNTSRIFDLTTLKYIHNNKYYLYQIEGYYPYDQELIRLYHDGKEGIMGWDGTIYFEPIYKNVYVSKKDNLKIACDGRQVQAWDIAGNQLWVGNYSSFQISNNKKFAVVQSSKDSLLGIADVFTGIIIFPFVYKKIYEGHNRVIAKKGANFGVLNLIHELLLDFEYQNITQYTDSLIAISKDGELYAVYDILNQKQITEFIYNEHNPDVNGSVYDAIVEMSPKEQPYEFKDNDLTGLKSPNDETLIPAIYTNVYYAPYTNSNIVQVNTEEGMGYYNIQLKREIVPPQYDYTNYHGLGGAYPPTSNPNVISLIYHTNSFDGRETMGFYTIYGRKICDPIYDAEDYAAFIGDYCSVSKNGKFGVIDINNKTIIPFEYDYVQYPFYKKALVQKDGQYGILEIID